MSDSSLTGAIKAYISARAEARLEKLDKEADKERKPLKDNAPVLAAFEAEYAKKRQQELAKYQPASWLDDAARRAKQISMVTHALKYTHTDAKGTSILATNYQAGGVARCLLSTTELSRPVMDVVGNAAALDVAGLLLLTDDSGRRLVDYLAEGDLSPLKSLSADEQQLAAWQAGFSESLESGELSSHKLSKQVYFPTGDNSYHLLSPLFSSSLAQALHTRITDYRFSDVAKDARKARREDKFHSETIVNFPKMAVQNFGGTKPQNVSQLNTQRRGKAFLLSASPPEWRSLPKPPASSTAFWNSYSRKAYRKAKFLAGYLRRVANRSSNRDIRRNWGTLVDELVDQLVLLAATIQTRQDWAGWSDQARLTTAEKLWLDPANPDPDFQRARSNNEWQGEIAATFAGWLNDILRENKLNVDDIVHREWATKFEEKLQQLQRDMGGKG